jgi:hypothetical protein
MGVARENRQMQRSLFPHAVTKRGCAPTAVRRSATRSLNLFYFFHLLQAGIHMAIEKKYSEGWGKVKLRIARFGPVD